MSYFGTPLYPASLPNQTAVVNVSGTTTLGVGAATYDKQFLITGAGGYTITLPPIDGVNFPSKSYSIFNNSSAACTITTNGTDPALLLGSSYTSMSILPGERFLVQNMVTSWVIALESASRTTTAPQFDNTIRSASTAFLQRQGVQLSNVQSPASGTTLDGTYAGGLVAMPVGSLILPSAASFPIGGMIQFFSGAAGGTLARNGSDSINVNGTAINSFTFGNGDTLTLTRSSATGVWLAIAGSLQLQYSTSLAGSKSGTNGYQRLPNGSIMQWGFWTTAGSQGALVTYPITFITGTISLTFGANTNTSAGIVGSPAGGTTTGFNINSYNTSGAYVSCSGSYVAIGY